MHAFLQAGKEPAKRLKGKVKFYDIYKDAGIIVPDEVQDSDVQDLLKAVCATGRDVFMPATEYYRLRLREIARGQPITCEIILTPNGFWAQNVSLDGEIIDPALTAVDGEIIKGRFALKVKLLDPKSGRAFAYLDAEMAGDPIPGYDPAKHRDIMVPTGNAEQFGWSKEDLRTRPRLIATEIIKGDAGFRVFKLVPKNEAARPASPDGQNHSVPVAAND